MGKFDGPHFQCKDDVVSIWVAKCPISDVPSHYFEENYGGEDDEPFNQFTVDFGFGFYDHDFVEGAGLKRCAPISEIIEAASYGCSFSQAASNTAGINETEHIFLMYNFRYDPGLTGVSESGYYKFIGVFEYDRNA